MGPFEGKKNRKVAQWRKKLKEGTLQSLCFRKCSKKCLAKARTRTRDRWVHREPSKVCTKKWYIHHEVCGLTKKKTSHCNSRALFTKKAPTKNVNFDLCVAVQYEQHLRYWKTRGMFRTTVYLLPFAKVLFIAYQRILLCLLTGHCQLKGLSMKIWKVEILSCDCAAMKQLSNATSCIVPTDRS